MCDKQGYTLHYFNLRGRGELIRYMFHYTNTAFVDRRMTNEEWAQFKPNAPLGQLPVLEKQKDGHSCYLCQSGAIIRHLASALGLNGKTPMINARADEAFESIKELMEAGGKVMFEQDPARKEQYLNDLKNNTAPKIIGFLEKRVQENGGKNIAGGDEYTFADLAVAQFFDSMHCAKNKMMDMEQMGKMCPGLCALSQKINESPEIKAYLAKRPESDF